MNAQKAISYSTRNALDFLSVIAQASGEKLMGYSAELQKVANNRYQVRKDDRRGSYPRNDERSEATAEIMSRVSGFLRKYPGGFTQESLNQVSILADENCLVAVQGLRDEHTSALARLALYAMSNDLLVNILTLPLTEVTNLEGFATINSRDSSAKKIESPYSPRRHYFREHTHKPMVTGTKKIAYKIDLYTSQPTYLYNFLTTATPYKYLSAWEIPLKQGKIEVPISEEEVFILLITSEWKQLV